MLEQEVVVEQTIDRRPGRDRGAAGCGCAESEPRAVALRCRARPARTRRHARLGKASSSRSPHRARGSATSWPRSARGGPRPPRRRRRAKLLRARSARTRPSRWSTSRSSATRATAGCDPGRRARGPRPAARARRRRGSRVHRVALDLDRPAVVARDQQAGGDAAELHRGRVAAAARRACSPSGRWVNGRISSRGPAAAGHARPAPSRRPSP